MLHTNEWEDSFFFSFFFLFSFFFFPSYLCFFLFFCWMFYIIEWEYFFFFFFFFFFSFFFFPSYLSHFLFYYPRVLLIRTYIHSNSSFSSFTLEGNGENSAICNVRCPFGLQGIDRATKSVSPSVVVVSWCKSFGRVHTQFSEVENYNGSFWSQITITIPTHPRTTP